MMIEYESGSKEEKKVVLRRHDVGENVFNCIKSTCTLVV